MILHLFKWDEGEEHKGNYILKFQPSHWCLKDDISMYKHITVKSLKNCKKMLF